MLKVPRQPRRWARRVGIVVIPLLALVWAAVALALTGRDGGTAAETALVALQTDHRTAAAGVAGVLREVGLDPGSALERVEEHMVVQEVELPFDTERRPDPDLGLGEEVVLTAGAPGLRRVVRRLRLEDGLPVSSEVVADEVVIAPEPRRVLFGNTGRIARGGDVYRYTQELVMQATAYTPGPESNPQGNGLTATGIPARYGVVAVDPAVIPLGTRVYVEGYGLALAADTGGAIKGLRIDVCYDTVPEALHWGVREVIVYVLD